MTHVCVRPTEKDRDTCLCKTHENLQCKADKMSAENAVRTRDINLLVQDIVCSSDSKQCMYRECQNCKNKKVKTFEEEKDLHGNQTWWYVWKYRREEREQRNAQGEKPVIARERQMGLVVR